MSRKNKRAYLRDYHQNPSGGYDYKGTFWLWENAETRKAFLRTGWAMLILALILMIAAGCLPAPGTDHAPYVLIPYAAGILACALGMMAMMRLTGEKEKIRGHIYDSSIGKMQPRLLAGIIFPLIAAAGEILYMAVQAAISSYGAGFAAAEAAAGVLMLLGYRSFVRMKWTKDT